MIDLSTKTFLYPTDTILGIGCNALDINLVQRLYSIKQRESSKPFILLVDSEKRLESLVEVPEMAWQLIDVSQDPITIVYDQLNKIPEHLLNKDKTIAIRLTKNSLCKKIIQSLDAPIISTSANISNQQIPRNINEVSEIIKNKIDYIFSECDTFVSEKHASSVIKVGKHGEIKILRQ